MSDNLKVVFPMRCDKKSSLVTAAVQPSAAAESGVVALIHRIEERCYADLVEACRFVLA